MIPTNAIFVLGNPEPPTAEGAPILLEEFPIGLLAPGHAKPRQGIGAKLISLTPLEYAIPKP